MLNMGIISSRPDKQYSGTINTNMHTEWADLLLFIWTLQKIEGTFYSIKGGNNFEMIVGLSHSSVILGE